MIRKNSWEKPIGLPYDKLYLFALLWFVLVCFVFLWGPLVFGRNDLSSGADGSNICRSNQVRALVRPIDIKNPSRGQFAWKFHINTDSFDPEAPTIIFFPGGPGQTGMTQALSYPTGFQVIRFDPRGLGCNSRNDFPWISSSDHTEDVVAMIQSLQLKNYFLHGISYGTMVATQVAHRMEKKYSQKPSQEPFEKDNRTSEVGVRPTLPSFSQSSQKTESPLKLLVLEGTLGRAFVPGEYWLQYAKNWNLFFHTLPPSVQKILREEKEPLGLPSAYWGNFISVHMLFGLDFHNQEDLRYKLSLLTGTPAERADLALWVRQFAAEPSRESHMQHQQIVCSEIAPDMRDKKFDFVLQDGELVPIENSNYCDQSPSSRRHLYDSSQFPFKTPTVVFHGEFDPATPQFQSEYFFSKAAMGPKFLIHVHNGGHAALSGSLLLCSDLFWSNVPLSPSLPSSLFEFTQACTKVAEEGSAYPVF